MTQTDKYFERIGFKWGNKAVSTFVWPSKARLGLFDGKQQAEKKRA